MKKNDVIKKYEKYILSTYTRTQRIFVKGKGMTLIDIDGKKYLDFFPGWGVSNVGHCHPKVMGAVRDQISKLIHVPNNFYNPQQAKLAEEIIRWSFPGKVFFANSGAEACEGAIKFARAYGHGSRHFVTGEARYEVISMNNSFHGRTFNAMHATGQKKYHEGFGPMPQGFIHVPFNDINALKNAVTDKTVAILLELVQGEGGINVADKLYVQEIRKICDEKKIILIFDEVQTGMGRTGEMFCFKNYGVTPDIMMLAKALGGGLPIGVFIVREDLSHVFKPGMHASTFGGSPVICKAALGVFKAIQADKMIKNTKVMGKYILEKLQELKKKWPCIKDVRGLGLMIGIELTMEGKAVFEECLNRGLIINCTQGNVLRFMPALNVTKKQADQALHILEQTLQKVTQAT